MNGVGPVPLPPRGKPTLTVPVSKGGWDAMKVGLVWWRSPE
jgi:hypothetical protein